MNATQPNLTLAGIERAAVRIAGRAVRTPLLSSPELDGRVGGRLLLKCENLQRTGSFKFRGACNALSALDAAVGKRGIVAVSSGNHAQGIAEAARLFEFPATIVMPADAPAVKRRRTQRSGAAIVDYDRESEDRDAVAARLIAKRGGTLIHPYDDADVIAGQGTAGLEILADSGAMGARIDAVLIPCGGGGLSAGIGLAMRAALPDLAIGLAEPAGFDDYGRSLAEGRIVTNPATSGSVCDALLAPSPGSIGFAINSANGARGIVVSDEEALAAVAFAFRELKLVVEPGGAVALAAALAGHFDCRGRTVAIVLSGGNIDPPMLERALAIS